MVKIALYDWFWLHLGTNNARFYIIQFHYPDNSEEQWRLLLGSKDMRPRVKGILDVADTKEANPLLNCRSTFGSFISLQTRYPPFFGLFQHYLVYQNRNSIPQDFILKTLEILYKYFTKSVDETMFVFTMLIFLFDDFYRSQ